MTFVLKKTEFSEDPLFQKPQASSTFKAISSLNRIVFLVCALSHQGHAAPKNLAQLFNELQVCLVVRI